MITHRSFALLALGLAGLIRLAAPSPAHACGPTFSRSLLSAGDDALCVAPPLDFDALVTSLSASGRQGQPNTLTTSEADARDLAAALAEQGASTQAIEQATSALQAYRAAIADEVEPALPDALPIEFELYLRGARAWHRDQHALAQRHFDALLALPADRRRHRSVWAAYMLGRLALPSECARARREFERTRELVAAGFVDTLGLGPASLGEQARCLLREGELAQDIPWEAITALYLEQLAAGDPWASSSLREVAAKILADASERPERLDRVVADPATRALIDAYLAAHPQLALDRGHASRWLDALARAGGPTTQAAGVLGWIAYQAGDMDLAARAVEVAGEPNDPLARWVAAKLTLRTGTPAAMEDARAQLLALERELGGDDLLVHDWRVTSSSAGVGPSAAADAALLAMRANLFVDALAALLRAGSWVDAAYVAEQVLELDELRAFVDALPEAAPYRVELRWLLARRLARADRWADALPYYPSSPSSPSSPNSPSEPNELRHEAERMRDELALAGRPALAESKRAELLWRAGKRMRELGMELTGTELEPDWFYYAGDFAPPGIGDQRASMAGQAELVAPTDEELARRARHVDPDMPRFHYRWRAAALGERAAALLPLDHEAGARVLCQAAHWVRARDLGEADRLTRAMIRRHPHVAIAHYGEHLLDDPVAKACTLEGIDFAAPGHPIAAESTSPERTGLGLLRRGWLLALAFASLALMVLVGLGVAGGPRSRER